MKNYIYPGKQFCIFVVSMKTKMTIMKKTMYAAFVFAALGLTACKGESSEGEGEMTDAKETVKEEKEMPTTFNVVAEESKLGWKGSWIAPTGENGEMEEQKHHTGTVQITDGSVTKDGDDISGNFTIDMTTIENSDLDGEQKAGLEMHLKGQREDDKGSFFNVDEYATVEVALNSIKDGMADITINVLGTDIEETVPVETEMDGDKMMLNGKFSVDFADLDFKMFSPNPEKPEEGHIDSNIEFNLKATLSK
mgnify:CR=1 FL=1